jgi:anti-sigma-K factor RskA
MADITGESIATTLRLSKALGLARQGRLREAQQLLAAEGTLPESIIELNALAALATSEGDYSRAQRLWRLLLQREPGHAEAKRMIDSIELWLSRPSWCRFIPAAVTVAVLAVVFAFIVWAMGDDAPPPRAPAPRPVVAAPAVEPQSAPPPSITLPSTTPANSRRRGNH